VLSRREKRKYFKQRTDKTVSEQTINFRFLTTFQFSRKTSKNSFVAKLRNISREEGKVVLCFFTKINQKNITEECQFFYKCSLTYKT
jgi:hypothetical protein